MRSLTVIFGILFAGCVCFGAAEPNIEDVEPREPNAASKPNAASEQEGKLERVTAEIRQLGQRIESNYDRRISDLQRECEEQIKLFETAERSAVIASAVRPARFIEFQGHIPQEGYTKTEDGLMIPNERIALADERIAAKKREIEAYRQRRTAELEKEKNYFLTVRLPDREKQSRSMTLNPPVETHGLVNGIVYGSQKRSALVDRKIVHEGETIYSIKVVEIHRRSIVFKKNDKSWVLRVGENVVVAAQ
ncbi:MAG: hypothetical protein JW720_15825 [Sedimentisphaerales bacterium]|nr:hypothetical protein [Sedimentisphaerales bacterium]